MSEASGAPSQLNPIDRPIEALLFEGQVQAVIATIFQNERPPSGLAGVLDWYFQGKVSQSFRAGIMTGKEGECVYFPMSSRIGTPYHLFFIGGGFASDQGERAPISQASLAKVQKNLQSLKISSIGVSRSDFGNLEDRIFKKAFQGESLWIGP